MPHPGPRHKNAGEVRVSLEDDTEHVPPFALVPIRCGTDANDRGGRRVLAAQGSLQAYVRIAFVGRQLVDDGEVARRLPVSLPAASLVNRGQIVDHPERRTDVV